VQYQLFSPVIVHDPTRRRFPLLVRTVLGLIDANDFLQLSTSDAPAAVLGDSVAQSRAVER
jgi:hypothetical protein